MEPEWWHDACDRQLRRDTLARITCVRFILSTRFPVAYNIRSTIRRYDRFFPPNLRFGSNLALQIDFPKTYRYVIDDFVCPTRTRVYKTNN